MLVKELIEKLKEQDQEAQIVFCDRAGLINNLVFDRLFTDDFEGRKIVPIFIGPRYFAKDIPTNENTNVEKNENSDNN